MYMTYCKSQPVNDTRVLIVQPSPKILTEFTTCFFIHSRDGSWSSWSWFHLSTGARWIASAHCRAIAGSQTWDLFASVCVACKKIKNKTRTIDTDYVFLKRTNEESDLQFLCDVANRQTQRQAYKTHHVGRDDKGCVYADAIKASILHLNITTHYTPLRWPWL